MMSATNNQEPGPLTHIGQCGYNDAQAGRPMRTLGLNYEAAHNYREGYNRFKAATLTLLDMGEPLPSVTPCPSNRSDCPSGCPACPIPIRTFLFQYGVVHCRKADLVNTTDEQVAEEYYLKGKLQEAFDDEMMPDEFNIMTDAHEQ